MKHNEEKNVLQLNCFACCSKPKYLLLLLLYLLLCQLSLDFSINLVIPRAIDTTALLSWDILGIDRSAMAVVWHCTSFK